MTATDTLPVPARLGRVSLRLAALGGWRRLAAAAALGGLATFALPPADLLPVLLVAFPGLIWLLDGVRTRKGAFAVGWFFGFGHHLLGLYWVSAALFTDIERFWWALPLSAAGLPVLMAMFCGGATLTFHLLRRRGIGAGLARPLLFAACWCLWEWLRGHVFTGFPWNLIGYGWVGVLPVLQTASLVGIYGLTLVTVLVASLPAALPDPDTTRRRAWTGFATGLALLAVLGGWGAWRLAGAVDEPVPGLRLRLVQAAIDQRLKWAPSERMQNFQSHLALSAAPPTDLPSGRPAPPPNLIIWPETAVPFFVEDDARVRQAIASVIPTGGLLITGAPRTDLGADGERRYYNGMVAVDGSGTAVASYDKFHLVPFGEYMPLRAWLPVGAIAGNGAEFSPGPGPRTLHLGAIPAFSPLICYESIFPAAVVDHADRPQWLLNLTNDAWYGRTAGPHQHFAINQVRAVEEGVPLVRAANTGISGVVDAYGRVQHLLGLGERGFIDTTLPKAPEGVTPYARMGDWIFCIMLLAGFLASMASRHRS
ncbi:apolipoprotein N-acyltransferase [Azospirillum picis]|uniref:Apolipoprotein N-acyltransferase n=1 Tax=Azospirillum picis TaxID=488438 RepID=A0ABU0MKZ0_9PROT|nr:apolipoprotein N-acyltransferase [Azospirillum picis]MBP2300339.1 apolipoprotein N-acyltransferase [Azospirillum picis]MDQ0534135.1 apolipoprotein N-acyltransferase [Azospirillum picis]